MAPCRRFFFAALLCLPRYGAASPLGSTTPDGRPIRHGISGRFGVESAAEFAWNAHRVDETDTPQVLELPIVRQLAAIFERRRSDCGQTESPPSGWVFTSRASKSGHVVDMQHFHGAIS